MNRITRRAATVVAAAALVPLLAGCWQGFNAQTNTQGPSGNGAFGNVGHIQIRSATFVRSAVNPSNMTLVSNFINTGTTGDVLTKVTTAPTANVAMTGGQITLNPVSEIVTGQGGPLYISAFGLNTPQSSYVSTTFSFKVAGNITLPILTVPPVGIYAGVEPGSPAPLPPKSGIGNPPAAQKQNGSKANTNPNP